MKKKSIILKLILAVIIIFFAMCLKSTLSEAGVDYDTTKGIGSKLIIRYNYNSSYPLDGCYYRDIYMYCLERNNDLPHSDTSFGEGKYSHVLVNKIRIDGTVATGRATLNPDGRVETNTSYNAVFAYILWSGDSAKLDDNGDVATNTKMAAIWHYFPIWKRPNNGGNGDLFYGVQGMSPNGADPGKQLQETTGENYAADIAVEVKNKTGDATAVLQDDGNFKVGPFKFSYPGTFVGVTATVEDFNGQESTIGVNHTSVTSDGDFYIYIAASDNYTKVTKVTLTSKVDNYVVEFDLLAGESNYQGLLRITGRDKNEKEKNGSATIDIRLTGNIKIIKTSKQTQEPLAGVKFILKHEKLGYVVKRGEETQYTKTESLATKFATNADGQLYIKYLALGNYEIREVENNHYGYYKCTLTGNLKTRLLTIKVTNDQRWIQVTGNVWNDTFSEKGSIGNNLNKDTINDNKDKPIGDATTTPKQNVLVKIKEKDTGNLATLYDTETGASVGTDKSTTTTDENGNYTFGGVPIYDVEKAKTVGYDNAIILSNYYIEFQYDGILYQSVNTDSEKLYDWYEKEKEPEPEPEPEDKPEIANGVYKIQSAINTNYLLDVQAWSMANGGNLHLYKDRDIEEPFPGETRLNERFMIQYQGDGWYNIYSVDSGKAIEIPGGSTANGTSITQYTANGSDAQMWKIVQEANGKYSFRNKKNENKAIDIDTGKMESRTKIQLWDYSKGNTNQQFVLAKQSESDIIEDGTYKLCAASNSNYLVDIAGASLDNNAKAMLYQDGGNQGNQKFNITHKGNGWYEITAVHSGKALEIPAANVTNETNISQYTPNNTEAQLWRVIPIGNGQYKFMTKCADAKTMDIAGATMQNGTKIEIFDNNNSAAQKFVLKKVEVENDNDISTGDSDFKIIRDGKYEIKTALNEYYQLNVAQNGNIQLMGDTNEKGKENQSQEFNIKYQGSGYSTIINVGSSKLVEVANSGTASGTNVQQYEDYDGDNQKWMFKDAGNDYYYIVSKSNGLYLKVADNVAGNEKNIAVYTRDESQAQKFKLEKVGENNSKASEDETDRASFNAKYNTVSSTATSSVENSSIMKDADPTDKGYNMSYTRANNVSTFENDLVEKDGSRIYDITATTKNIGGIDDYDFSRQFEWGVEKIDNINLGLYEREQPDLALQKDVQNVQIAMNGYNHAYTYADRFKNNTEQERYESMGVKFGNTKASYNRTVYKSDVSYEDKTYDSDLRVFVMYKIQVKNESTSLNTEFRVSDYIDERFETDNIEVGTEIKDERITKGAEIEKKNDGRVGFVKYEGYNKIIILGSYDELKVNAGKTYDIYMKLELKSTAIEELKNTNNITLNNIAEIDSYTTYSADGKKYAGVDNDSCPGNVVPGDVSTYEDDTDIAPGMGLEIKDDRELSGIVFEDNNGLKAETQSGKVREGNSIYDSDEPTIGGVKVTLQEKGDKYRQLGDINRDGVISYADVQLALNQESLNAEEQELADVNGDKDLKAGSSDALFILRFIIGEISEFPSNAKYPVYNQQTYETITVESEGKYKFKEEKNGNITTITPIKSENATGDCIKDKDGKDIEKDLKQGEFYISGYIPGKYNLTYTWGGQTYTKDGETTTYNVEDYKGTIFNKAIHEEEGGTKWYRAREYGDVNLDSEINEKDVDLVNKYILGQVELTSIQKEIADVNKDGNIDIMDSIGIRDNIKRYSDAIDNYDTRKTIDEETSKIEQGKIGNYNTTKMESTTPEMQLGVEREYNYNGHTSTVSEGGSLIYDYNVKNIDFGIIERARQEITINKKVSHIKLTYANGMVMINTDIKANVTPEFTSKGLICPGISEANPLGQINIELDNEMIQGSTLEVTYTIKVENKSEKDYIDENFYKYGEITGKSTVVTLTPHIYDYLDSEWGLRDENYGNWDEVTRTKFIEEKTTIPFDEIKNTERRTLTKDEILQEDIYNEKDKIIHHKGETLTAGTVIIKTTSETGGVNKTYTYEEWEKKTIEKWQRDVLSEEVRIMLDKQLAREFKPNDKDSVNLYASKVLTSTDDISLDNRTEIYKITKEPYGRPIKKTSIFKSIVPTVEVIPPTGGNQNKLPYIITGAVALITIAGGIILIKKKAI